jgi:protein SCO1/2
MRFGRTALLGIGIVALLGGIWIGNLLVGRMGPGAPMPDIQGAIYAEPRAIPPFQLTDHRGRALTLKDLKGRWTLIYFGYTYCPDVCPTTLATLSAAQKILTASGKDEQTAYLFISVDPARDTPERLASYTPHFSEQLLSATGEPEQLRRLSHALGVIYIKVGDDPDDYLMDHSSVVLVINPAGKLQAVLTAPHTVDRLVTDFTLVRDYYQG